MAVPRDDPLFPTMVIGSLPRPGWVVDLIGERTRGRITDAEAESQLDDAVLSAIRMQEWAGLDYISDGEWRRENYARVFADKVSGFRRQQAQRGQLTLQAFVIDEIERRGPIACGEAQFLRRHTDRKTIVALPSPSTVADLMWHPEHSAAAYPTRAGFARACASVLREEVIALAALGVDAIQLDEPLLHRVAAPVVYALDDETPEETVDLAVETVNMVTEGLEEVFITVHLCHAHGVEPVADRTTALMGRAVREMRADRFAMEFNSPAAQALQTLADFPADRLLGLGVIWPGGQEVETPELVVERAQRALEFVDKERLVLNPDCGFGTTAGPETRPDHAYQKLAAMCRGAALLRGIY